MTRAFLRTVTLAAVAVALAPGAVPAAQPDHTTHLIQISLLAASKSGASELADLPANTRQAIEDVRRFLPFKSYRLLDTALLRTERWASTNLTGPEARPFRATMTLGPRPEPGKLLVQNFQLIGFGLAPPDPAKGGEAAGAPAVVSAQTVLTSSFAADVGQTVVVGTSRLDGDDEALIVLFTALE